MNRRGFLSSCLALAAAPAIVRADSLMRVIPRNTEILAVSGPIIIDCTEAFHAIIAQTFKTRRAETARSLGAKSAYLRVLVEAQLRMAK